LDISGSKLNYKFITPYLFFKQQNGIGKQVVYLCLTTDAVDLEAAAAACTSGRLSLIDYDKQAYTVSQNRPQLYF